MCIIRIPLQGYQNKDHILYAVRIFKQIENIE